jgi:hypothetical protein
MKKTDKDSPNFFKEGDPDPVDTATGGRRGDDPSPDRPARAKRKAGFYLSQEVLDRFNTKFYELKLAGLAVENKSGLLELALQFALDDLDRGELSVLLAQIKE